MKNLFIIDVYNLIYRMFYAIPEINTRAGKPVNAVFGVAKFLKSLWENGETHHLVVANDAPGKNIRNALYADYKGTRDRMPDNLRSQIEDVFALFRALHIPILEQECYEADDIIGSIVCHIKNQDKNGVDWADFQAVIISSDKDLCQFVEDGKIHIFDAMKQKFMRRADVIEKFSIPPEQVVDYLAII
jgi:DNA polymerase I